MALALPDGILLRPTRRRRWAYQGRVMEFRWIAILALWTLLVGPMLQSPLASRTYQARSR
jgi:hypothetical protein